MVNKATTSPRYFFYGSGLIVLLTLFSILFTSETTSNVRSYLITAVYDMQAAENHIVHLYRTPFTNGVPEAQEKIMDVVTQQAGDRVPRIRFDLGPNQIYRNRYIITSYGNVIDIKSKKVLVDAHDQFMKASGDSIIFYINDIFRGQFYSLLDLKTGTYAEIKSPSFRIITNKDVQPDCGLKNYKIWYYPASAEKIELVKDAGYGEDVSLIPGGKHQLPMMWIDKDNFLYPNYSSDHGYVSIMKVCVSTREEEKIGFIDNLPENHKPTSFYKNPEGEIVYQCARGDYKIEIQKKKITELTFLSAGNGFSVSVNETSAKGREIRNGESVIGTYFCEPTQVISTKGLIAFPYDMVLGKEHYLQGYAVWSSATSKWKMLGDSDLSALVGWVNE